MYRNLEAELARNGIKKKEIAELLDVTLDTVTRKIKGDTSFIFEEAVKIRNEYFQSMRLEYLFQKTEA